ALFDELDFPDYTTSGNPSLDEFIWELLAEPHNLKNLMVKLIEQFGIAYSESELKGHCRKLEEAKIIVERNPSTTPTGRKAISYDYKKYNIILKRA
ncbi:MAG: hypothetical protein Q7J01_00145, partial [Syntrophales bacterium]|nr:hypothetical protein [Syntrophales bacterium]